MSLQQSNVNKFPKHMQHVRIQKEEEEEQWISGEELCTEGSSDEENTNDIKKKFKVKPTHHPSKELIQIKKSASMSSAKESDDENTDSTTQNSPTQWRPKRGSIKLPNIEEKHLNFEDDKWSTEFKYHQLKSYKNKLNSNENNNEKINLNDEDVILIMENDLDKFDAYTSDCEKVALDDTDIINLENDLEKLHKILQSCTRERKDYQKEVCEKLTKLSSSSLELKNTKKFHDLFKYKSNAAESECRSKTKLRRKRKTLWQRNHKFPLRKNMMDAVLNKDEQARLAFLLSDIEIKEIETTEKDKENIKEIKIENMEDSKLEKAFRSTDEEMCSLYKIDQKLKTLQEMCDDADLKGKLSEDIYSVDEENREWKAYLKLNELKFRRINEKINKLHEQDEPKETEDTTENSQET